MLWTPSEPVCLQRSLLALREIDVTVASVKITQLPKLQEDSLVLSVQLETDEKGQKMNKKKKQELYHNLHNVSGIVYYYYLMENR